MNHRRSILRHCAVRLAAHAEKALPRSRADWARAMSNEIQHISGNHAALGWALGCVVASYAQRMRAMIGNHLRIARWVLVLEMLCCFTPLTWLALAVLAHLQRTDAQWAALALTAAAAGPIGLIVAFKVVVLKRPRLQPYAAVTLCACAAWTGLACSLQILAGSEPAHHWREFVLIALLPAVGILHLVLLASGDPERGALSPAGNQRSL